MLTVSESIAPKIRLLPPEEARKIAAGEVVDRPAALVREFVDNALDAGASTVELNIEEGGIRLVEVSDDGAGMGREDLALCWLTHATSKIRSLDDLGSVETLGFRGEALAAATAVARLEIITSTGPGSSWRLEVEPGLDPAVDAGTIERANRTRGTSVRARGLFDLIPARKRFLKREGSEANLCKTVFIDKALAFPRVSFRFVQDGKLRLFLPAVASLRERFAAALLERNEALFLHEIAASGQGFGVSIVSGGPELSRGDRARQYVFANGRRVDDYSMRQALEYGLQGFFPNGSHPLGALFIDVDPALADFNIHPAKREVRFSDGAAIHHAITTALRDFTRRRGIQVANTAHGAADDAAADGTPAATMYDTDQHFLPTLSGGAENRQEAADRPSYPSAPDGGGGNKPNHYAASLAMEALLDRRTEFAPLPRPALADGMILDGGALDTNRTAAETAPAYTDDEPFTVEPLRNRARLAGRVFGLFILIEKMEQFFIIDQHAAHERVLYDRFLSKPIEKQELLVAIPFATESDADDAFLESRREELAKLGVVISGGRGAWHIEALPVSWRLSDAATTREILNLKNAGENLAERWAATLACHEAVRDGDWLDDNTALALAEEALALPFHRCPHGRPIWLEIGREDVLKAVRRLE
jgi:DNA mismatch repair protein MutL